MSSSPSRARRRARRAPRPLTIHVVSPMAAGARGERSSTSRTTQGTSACSLRTRAPCGTPPSAGGSGSRRSRGRRNRRRCRRRAAVPSGRPRRGPAVRSRRRCPLRTAAASSAPARAPRRGWPRSSAPPRVRRHDHLEDAVVFEVHAIRPDDAVVADRDQETPILLDAEPGRPAVRGGAARHGVVAAARESDQGRHLCDRRGGQRRQADQDHREEAEARATGRKGRRGRHASAIIAADRPVPKPRLSAGRLAAEATPG